SDCDWSCPRSDRRRRSHVRIRRGRCQTHTGRRDLRSWHGRGRGEFHVLVVRISNLSTSLESTRGLQTVTRRLNPVFRSLNTAMPLLGAELNLFFVVLVMGAGVFNLLHSLFGGILMFGLLYVFARWATKTDPEILRLILNSAKARQQYDPVKFTAFPVRVVS